MDLGSIFDHCGDDTVSHELETMYANGNAPDTLQAAYAATRVAGAKVGVVVNEADCLYYWSMCAFGIGRDTRFTEWAPNDWNLAATVGDTADLKMYPSHVAVLYDGPSMAQLAAFIGPQNR